MPIYISLMNMTDQGVKDIKNAPQRTADAVKGLEAMGGKLIDLYFVMGQYDYVGIAEAPNDEVAMAFLAGLGAAGNVRTTTMKGYRASEIGSILAKIPQQKKTDNHLKPEIERCTTPQWFYVYQSQMAKHSQAVSGGNETFLNGSQQTYN